MVNGKAPRLAIVVSVAEVFMHCAKALMRSRLWDPALHVDRSCLPTLGQMINEQTGGSTPVETQEEMLARYQAEL